MTKIKIFDPNEHVPGFTIFTKNKKQYFKISEYENDKRVEDFKVTRAYGIAMLFHLAGCTVPAISCAWNFGPVNMKYKDMDLFPEISSSNDTFAVIMSKKYSSLAAKTQIKYNTELDLEKYRGKIKEVIDDIVSREKSKDDAREAAKKAADFSMSIAPILKKLLGEDDEYEGEQFTSNISLIFKHKKRAIGRIVFMTGEIRFTFIDNLFEPIVNEYKLASGSVKFDGSSDKKINLAEDIGVKEKEIKNGINRFDVFCCNLITELKNLK